MIPAGAVALGGSRRLGVKGMSATDTLGALGLSLPARPNGIVPLALAGKRRAGRVLRLGTGEYLVEQDEGSDLLDRLAASLESAAQSAWTVERADAAIAIPDAVAASCLPTLTRFDTDTLRQDPGLLAMTQLAGIGVTLAHDPALGGFRLWCDAGFRDYLLDCFRRLLDPATPHP